MDNQQRRLQQELTTESIDFSTLHKKWLNTPELVKSFLQDLHIRTKQELLNIYNIPTIYILNRIMRKVYSKYKELPLPYGFVLANLFDSTEYAINRDGVVITIKTRRIVLPYLDEYGYFRVNTRHTKPSGKIAIYERLHRLIGMTFIPCKDFSAFQINHIDGVKTNNSISNLEWVTQADNLKHAWINNLRVLPNCSYKSCCSNVQRLSR